MPENEKPADSLDNLKTPAPAQPKKEDKPKKEGALTKLDKATSWKDGDGGIMDTLNDRLNPADGFSKAEKDRMRVSRILRSRQKVKCLVTRPMPDDKMMLICMKRPRTNAETFFALGHTYHLDLEKIVIVAQESYLIYQEGTAEPLEFKMGKITGSSSVELDMIKRTEIVKQVFRALSPKGNTDIMMYVMMGVVAVAAFAIGYVVGTGAFFHPAGAAGATSVTTTTSRVVTG